MTPVREQPPQQAPPVQRMRIRYAKRGRLRFTSHRDFSRAFERAVVRARLPMAYSSGFNPHPRISYAGAAPTGSASEAEYLEIGLAQEQDPAEIRERLAAAMPDGLDVVEVAVSPGGSLADLLTGSRWQISLSDDRATLEPAVTAFLAADEVPVERMTKKGLRTFDCRSSVASLAVADPRDGDDPSGPGRTPIVDLELVLRHQVPAVRPDDVLAGMTALTGWAPVGPPVFTRLQQGGLDAETGAIADPLGLAP